MLGGCKEYWIARRNVPIARQKLASVCQNRIFITERTRVTAFQIINITLSKWAKFRALHMG